MPGKEKEKLKSDLSGHPEMAGAVMISENSKVTGCSGEKYVS